MAYEHLLRVRYGETDQMGVVHHANHLLYLEEARTAYMASLGCPYGAVEAMGIGLPVRSLEVHYQAPAFYEDELLVGVSVGRVRAASVIFDYEIRRPRDGTSIATARVELACVSLESGARTRERRPIELPADLRAALETAPDLPAGGSPSP